MRIASVAKLAANHLLALVGYSLTRTVDAEAATFRGAVARLAGREHAFRTVTDVGASNGSWSLELQSRFPTANYLLLEANQVHAAALSHFCESHLNASYVLTAVAEQCGEIYFDASDPFGGLAMETPTDSSFTRVACTSIDAVVAQQGCNGPFLIKLDTHGFEVPILRGATETLKQADALVIECYNFRIAPECLLFYEMCQYLDKVGFRCIDLFDPLYRPLDHSFWQCDMVFVRKERAEFARNEYDVSTVNALG